MEDLIGYVTVNEADEYVKTHYVSTDDLRVSWDKTSKEDKIALLNKSFQAIELLPFTGRKTVPGQSKAFPRYPDTEIPDQVKWAQIENACMKCDPTNEEDTKYYERLWTYGIESYSIGNLSESIGSGTYGLVGAQSTGIISAVATRLLMPYLGGGYSM